MPLHCPRDSNLLLKEEGARAVYHCGDCSGLWASLPLITTDKLSLLDRMEGELRCPKDGSRMFDYEVKGVALEVCGKCRSVSLDGTEKSRLLSGPPDWLDDTRPETPETIAAGVVVEAVIAVLTS